MGAIAAGIIRASGIIDYTIYRCTDFNAGKFFDVPATNKYFGDWSDAFTTYETYANEHFLAMDSVATTDTWMGVDADAAKTLLSDTETTLLNDILKLHDDIDSLHATILDNFKLTVDSAADAYISYDDLMKIDNDFKEKSEAYDTQAKAVEDMILDLREKYSKYGTIRTQDFSAGRTAFTNLCGDDETVGYLEECRQKLVQFDTETQILIEEADLDSMIDDLNQRMTSFIIETHPEYHLDSYVDDIDEFESKYKEEKAKTILCKNASLWTVNDAYLVCEWYETAVKNEDQDSISRLYDILLINECQGKNIEDNGEVKYCEGKNYDLYVSYLDPAKTSIMFLVASAKGKGDKEAYTSLLQMSQNSMVLAVETGKTPPAFSITTKKVNAGISVRWNVLQESGIKEFNEAIIFNKEGLTLQEKFELIEEDEGVSEEYRSKIKATKDDLRRSKLEEVTSKRDFNEHNGYEKDVNAEADDRDMYEYINDSLTYRTQLDIAAATGKPFPGSEFLDDGLEQMTDEQKKIYNYLYYQDSVNGTDTADEYIELLGQSLIDQSAQKIIVRIDSSDSSEGEKVAIKTALEVGVGLRKVGTGLANAFDLNDDRDGVAKLGIEDYMDYYIMTSAKSTGEATLYNVARFTGEAIPGIAVTVGTGGEASPVLLGTLYGTSAGGNAKAEAERAGYTPNQAATYGALEGTKQGVKVAALSRLGGSGSGSSLLSKASSIIEDGAIIGGMEFADETIVDPNIRYNVLNDENAYINVDFKQAAKNAGTAAGIGMAVSTFNLMRAEMRGSGSVSEVEDAAILETVDDVELASEERLLVDINEAELAAGETGKIAEGADEARAIKEIAEVEKVAESGNIIDNSDRISKGESESDIDRIQNVAQQSYDYAVDNPRQSGLNRMQLGKDAEVQATRWTRKWAERNGIDLSEEGLHFQVRGNHSIPDVVYEPTHSIMDFKLTPKAIRKVQSDNFKLDFPDYSIEYIFGPGPWRDK
ncbi:hypothetical protein [Pseudobutyrivibrio sp. MD2005]|uniref:hypothetical protein n=1 Tax=Pseudobutyrivibrio sp. MD2005 TaxID=1410616 RepID=UPI000488B272|nr:hypothetical protein [Pseudobutyrivibrio sp. MD2005]